MIIDSHTHYYPEDFLGEIEMISGGLGAHHAQKVSKFKRYEKWLKQSSRCRHQKIFWAFE
ncbi:MAG: hypothetical protein A2169_15410 [Deltaproteobacteria bacterium RBG_13_47_9]|nr:MAG: hypothetical protein A2169_15410 [Deltaproteobacteria bacterium RBG_13_47_9]